MKLCKDVVDPKYAGSGTSKLNSKHPAAETEDIDPKWMHNLGNKSNPR